MENTNVPVSAETFTEASFEELARKDLKGWIEAFKEIVDVSDRELAEGDFYQREITALGMTVNEVHSEGGCEGGGDYAEIVYAVVSKTGEQLGYFRYTGFYSSYEGTDWDTDYMLVEPRQVTYTEYFPIKG